MVSKEPQSVQKLEWHNGRHRSSCSGLGDLSGFDAACADIDPFRRSIHDSPDALDVRVPATFVAPMRMADAHPKRRVLAAHLTYRSHDAQPRR